MLVLPSLLANGASHLQHWLHDFFYKDMERAIRGWDPEEKFRWDLLRKNSIIDLDVSKKKRKRLKIFQRLVH